MTRIAGTVHEDIRTFLIVSRSGHLEMKSVSDKILTENKAYFAFNIFFGNLAVYETVWKILYSWAGHR